MELKFLNRLFKKEQINLMKKFQKLII